MIGGHAFYRPPLSAPAQTIRSTVYFRVLSVREKERKKRFASVSFVCSFFLFPFLEYFPSYVSIGAAHAKASVQAPGEWR